MFIDGMWLNSDLPQRGYGIQPRVGVCVETTSWPRTGFADDQCAAALGTTYSGSFVAGALCTIV